MTAEEIAKARDEKGKRAVFYYESAKRSVLAAEALLKRLEVELADLEPSLDGNLNVADRVGPILIDAMGVVDFAHRFGQLMEGMPLLKESMRRLHFRKLRDALIPVTNARNHFQHLRSELALGSSIDYPLMGSMTWIQGNQYYAVGLLTHGLDVTFPSMAYGAFGRGYVARYQYTVASWRILLDPLVASMRESFNWLASVLKFTDSSFDKVGWGQAVAFSSAFDIEVIPFDLVPEATGSNPDLESNKGS